MAEEAKKKDRGLWFREMKSELKKVVWPNKQTVLKNTGTVLLVLRRDRRLHLDLRFRGGLRRADDPERVWRLRSKDMSDSAKWYVIHTYSGYENAVKTSIEKFVTGRNMEDMILRMEIPMETVTEVTDSGATKEVERKVFPGYVLIKMVMTDDTWHLVRNVRGVTGFVGSANKPIPLTEEEVLAMGMEKHEIVVRYNVGDHVKIVDGPLASFTGVVEEIEPEKNRVSVMVSMFGRETPVDLELDQVEVQN